MPPSVRQRTTAREDSLDPGDLLQFSRVDQFFRRRDGDARTRSSQKRTALWSRFLANCCNSLLKLLSIVL